MIWETSFNVAIMKVCLFVYEFTPLKLMTDLKPRPVSWSGTDWSRSLCAHPSLVLSPLSWVRSTWGSGRTGRDTGGQAAWSLEEWADFCLWCCWLCWCWDCLFTGPSIWARRHSRFNVQIQHRVKGRTSLPKCDNVLLAMLDARWFLLLFPRSLSLAPNKRRACPNGCLAAWYIPVWASSTLS